jgi:hypothetical protein
MVASLASMLYPQIRQPRFIVRAKLAVLTLFFILFVLWFSLAVLLAAGSLAIQRYIYSEPSGHILWGAPAAAAVLTVFLAFWCFVNYRAADPKAKELPYGTLFTSSGSEDFGDPVRELWAEKAGVRTHYTRFTEPGVVPRYEYREASSQKPWKHDKSIQAVIVKEGDSKQPQEVRFVTNYDAGRYEEEGGKRYMNMDNFGRIFTPRAARSFWMIVLNILHLGVWFLMVWLLLRFQWSHALGLAAVFWLAMTMLFVPQILDRVPRKAEAPPTATSQLTGPDREGRVRTPVAGAL